MRSWIASLAAVAVVMTAPQIAAQDARAAARDVVKKWQGAVVNVRVVLKTRMSMGGREMSSADDSVDAVGTVIDPSGLTVMSLGSLNPGAMMNKIVGASMGSGGNEQQGRDLERAERAQDAPARRPRAARQDRPARRGSGSRVHPPDHQAGGAARFDCAGGVGHPGAARSSRGAVAARAGSAAGRRRPRWPTSARSSSGRGRSTCWAAPRRAWARRRSARRANWSGS